MKRLRVLFAVILFSLALPVWRFTDFLAIFSPFDWPLTFSLTLTFALFIVTPLKLLFVKMRPVFMIFLILGVGFSSYTMKPLSTMATKDSHFNHCGVLTWTGAFYPLRGIMSDAHKDDIEARNQMCWVRKMIQRVPDRFESKAELSQYVSITTDKLLSPSLKYRISLPLVTLLHITIFTRYAPPQATTNDDQKMFIAEGIKFWQDQYTDMISERQYGMGSFPHSTWIKFEYGLIERNWNLIIENLTIEE
jgi:hypothetical protein